MQELQKNNFYPQLSQQLLKKHHVRRREKKQKATHEYILLGISNTGVSSGSKKKMNSQQFFRLVSNL